MKKLTLLVICLVSSLFLSAQEKMYIHKSDNMTLGALISTIDSIYFSNDGTITYFRIDSNLAQYPTAQIDSLSFGDNSNTIFVTYNTSGVSVINPLAFEGVSVSVEGQHVTVNSTSETQDINYSLSGTTQNGMFKIYSDKRFNLLLNGVSITNQDGPAINVQSKKKTSVELIAGTTNYVTDGATYAPPAINGNGEEEDQKGTFFSEAKLVFSGTGSLTIEGNGSEQHALCSDDLIQVDGGNITVTKAVVDGIHGKDGIEITGGAVNVTASGDAIDGDEACILISGGTVTTNNTQADVKGISCDSTLTISGGTLDLTISGDQSKAIQSNQAMTLSGGSITIHNAGNVVLAASGSGFDPSYPSSLKSDSLITISGADITITSTGKGGKGITSNTGIAISGGNLTITNSGNGERYKNSSGVYKAYVASCLNSDGYIAITGGTVTTTSSGSGGRGITPDGALTIGSTTTSPTVSITTTGSDVFISGSGNNASYAEAKAITGNGDIIFESGTVTIASADDGIKSETSVTFNNADVTISNSYEGIEAPFITVNGGSVKSAASDDSFNATFGNGGEFDDGSLLKIQGGTVVANASTGDGLDSNGSIMITGGTTIVHGPQSAPEVGMDFNGTCNVNGGFLVISGINSNMTQPPSPTSSQHSVLAKTNNALSSTTLFHVQDDAGNDILTFQPARNYSSVIFSTSSLQTGVTYSIYKGGTSTGTNNNGLYTGGTYSGGTFKKSFTISNTITTVTF
ncbi:MAG TPA: carbohydrate-binding domain-containing protein [Bacteroidales bacterium]|nr:carbohydrate-binding domain-containing protein [Bacteroidales bacterium]